MRSVSPNPNPQRRQISVVVPVFNEEETIAPLLAEIGAVLDALDADSEIVVVDDGSADATAQILLEWTTRQKNLRVITLEKNSGQGAALLLGLNAAAGETIVTLDGDGQNVPADIPKLLEALHDSDLVVGIREGRRDSRLRRWMSKIANAVRSRLLGDGVSDSGCALKAMRRETVGALIPMQTLYSFVPALVAGGGYRVTEIPVTHRERQGGTSHYSLRKMLWRPLVDMLGVCWFNKRRCDAPVAATRTRFTPAVTAIAIAAAFFLFLGNHGLLEPDEGRYAEVAREMSASGDLVIPTLNGLAHVEKPPVIYWFTALSYRVFGVSEFSARLPSALAALGIVLLTFGIGRELGGRRVGWLAALVLASSLQFFFMARLLTADMMMAFWITAAVACAVKHHFHPSVPAFRWLFFVFMGIGFLTKGPMALVVPISAAAGLGWKAEARSRLPWLRGMLLCLAVSLSWFIVVSVQNPSLFDYFLTTELRDRFLSSNHGRQQPFWFFFPVIAAGFLPWSLLLLPALFKRLRRPRALGARARFLLLWVGVPLLVLSLSGSKLLTYVLPLFPALAIAMALALSKGVPAGRTAMGFLGGAAIALAAALFAWPYLAPEPLRFSVSLLSGLVIAISGGALIFVARRDSEWKNPHLATRLAFCSVTICLAIASQVDRVPHLLGRQASMREIAATLEQQPGYADARIIASNIRAHGLEFYLTRTVDVTRGQADLVLPTSADQQRRLHKSSRTVARIREQPAEATFAVTRQPDWTKHFEPSGRWNTIQRSGDFLLLQLVETEESLAVK